MGSTGQLVQRDLNAFQIPSSFAILLSRFARRAAKQRVHEIVEVWGLILMVDPASNMKQQLWWTRELEDWQEWLD